MRTTSNTTARHQVLASGSLFPGGSEPAGNQPGNAPQDVGIDRGRKIVALLVEDNRPDVLMVEEAIEMQGLSIELHVLDDGEKACDFFDGIDNHPEVVKPEVLLLDLNLPKRTGKDVLACLRRSHACRHIPVLIITSSDAAQEREELRKLGIAGYFRKPASYDEFMKIGLVLQRVLDEYKLQ